MQRCLPFILLLLTAPAAAAEHQWIVTADAWYLPRDGARVASMPPVEKAVHAWLKAPKGRLVIRYPGGEEGILWSEELRDWLVSLGIPSEHIETASGLDRNDAVIIVLRDREESSQ